MKIRVINTSGNPLPEYATASSAGMDIRAMLGEPVVLMPGQRTLVPTGLKVEIPDGYEMQLRPRSGLALRSGITLVNTPGTIDADYRGEIGVILINLSQEPFTINPGERICQAVVAPVVHIQWEEASDLTESERGAGGFGHSGTK
ncbi:MAG: dUTP diphosphatase [Muribaculaceae bacterium]|nr:dUTP diphosphatase [Muribaculaceae bacterium]